MYCHQTGCTNTALYVVGNHSYCGKCAEFVMERAPGSHAEAIAARPRPQFPEIFMRLAVDLSGRSTCARLQVGCVITTADFREVLALGYNGGPIGGFNGCKSLAPGQCGHIHAEDNACNYAPARVPKIAFINYAPCEMCAIRMVNKMGFLKVYYGEAYRSTAGLDVLLAAGIQVEQMRV